VARTGFFVFTGKRVAGMRTGERKDERMAYLAEGLNVLKQMMKEYRCRWGGMNCTAFPG
jgi:ABC-type branched-subunit amino acid transport system ATPase component